jgi:glucose/arabinose dehydrogenase
MLYRMTARVALTLPVLLIPLVLASACSGGGGNSFDVPSELVTAAPIPISMAFAPDGRLFYNEQYTGNVRVIAADGTLQDEPFAQVEIFPKFEWGLIGLALDPDFDQNGYVYVSYMETVSTQGEGVARPVVMRFTDSNGRGVSATTIVDDLPDTDPDNPHFSAVGSIDFGPDGFLYISIGDYDLFDVAQDLSVPQGKILRVNSDDGSPPPDNPFIDDLDADPRIFAYGFRKAFSFAFHPQSGEMYATDLSGVTCEELNLVTEGQNYGWPLTHEFRFADCLEGQTTAPIHFFAPEGQEPVEHLAIVTPIGLTFLTGSAYPLLTDNSLLVCERKTNLMRRLVLDGAENDRVVEDDVVVEDCTLDIAISPDGTIYYSNEREIRRLNPE